MKCRICKSTLDHKTYVYDGYVTCQYDYWPDREFKRSKDQIITIGDYVKASYGIGKVRKIYYTGDVVPDTFEHIENKPIQAPEAYVTWKSGDYIGGGWKYWKLNQLVKVEKKI